MTENYCVEHQTIWFKKGAMKSYAHPIKDAGGVTTGWCNKPRETEDAERTKAEIEKLPPGKIDNSAMEQSAREGKIEEAKIQQQVTAYDHSRNKSMSISYVKDVICSLISAGAIKSELTDEQWGRMFVRADKIAEWIEK